MASAMDVCTEMYIWLAGGAAEEVELETQISMSMWMQWMYILYGVCT